MIPITTLLTDAFEGVTSHSLPVQKNGKLIGMIHMRDLLGVYAESGSLRGKRVFEFMNQSPISIEKTDNLLKPARLFVEHRIKSLLVIDKESGDVSNIGPEQLIKDLPAGLLGFYQHVSRIMVSNLITVQPETSLKDAIALLVERRLSCLPICNPDGDVLGMLSESDMLKAVMRKESDDTPVSELMAASPVTIGENTSLQQTWDTMCDSKVMKVFVVSESGRLVGLITATDVLISLCESLLSTFAIYHCPEETDLMVEWHKHGMVMAASEKLTSRLGCQAEDLVGLHWNPGCDEDSLAELLKLPKNETMEVQWSYNGMDSSFQVSRDIEQAVMWWKLN